MGNWLIFLGICLVVAGLIAKSGWLSWFAHLPGDIHVRREGFQFYLPITSMILISIVLTGIVNLVRKFF